MKKSARFGLTIIFSVVFFGVLNVVETPAQLTQILNKMDAHQKSLTTLRSKVTMNQYNSQLQESDVIEGTAIYARTADYKLSGRLDWIKPAETVAMVNDKYIVYLSRLRQAYTGALDKTTGNDLFVKQISFLSMSKKDVKAQFNVRYDGIEKVKGEITAFHLMLTPKISGFYKTAELWLSREGMPVQIKINKTDNDSITVLFSDYKKNAAINQEEFKVKLPKKTIILNDSGISCFHPKIEDARVILENESDAVFSGKIIGGSNGKYTFQTERIWKGVIGREITVKDFIQSPADAVKLTNGGRYIVFARNVKINGDVVLAVTPCSLTGDLASEEGRKTVKFLGNGKPVKQPVIRKKRKSIKRRSARSI